MKSESAVVTAGSRDKTVRMWKVPEESQLVFRAGMGTRLEQMAEGGIVEKIKPAKEGERRYVEGLTEAVAMIDDAHFLSGGDSGFV